MYQIAGAAQMKELDRQAIEEYGISSLELMERAARAVAEEVRGLLEAGSPDFIGGADSVAVLGAGAETEEDRRELEALQALAEKKNQDPTPWGGGAVRPRQQRRGRRGRRPHPPGHGLSGPSLPGGRPEEDDAGRAGHGEKAGRSWRRAGGVPAGGPPADAVVVSVRLPGGRPARGWGSPALWRGTPFWLCD